VDGITTALVTRLSKGFIKMFSSLTATVKAALAVGGTVAVGALVFGFGLPIGIVAGTVAAFGTKAALDKSA
jgi:hypothetical protein